MDRRTRIVATIGPASNSRHGLIGLCEAGMDVARIGLAHGEAAEHACAIERVRRAATDTGRAVGVLIDLPGPKLRVAPSGDGPIDLATGQRVDLLCGAAATVGSGIGVDDATVAKDLRVGDRVVIGDGTISLRVEAIDGATVGAVVLAGGRIAGRPGIHVPSSRLRHAAPTARDLELLRSLQSSEVDFVAVSFVRGADDLHRVRDALGSARPLLVAKIETAAAVAALDEILEASDAVMVARGDLGLDCPLEDLPHLQKRIIRRAIELGRVVITATQMLESMITNQAPTRAEVTDVANAVFDGTDAVMLSGETAIGQDPRNVVTTMARLLERAEREADYLAWGGKLGKLQRRSQLTSSEAITDVVTRAAWRAAVDLGAAAIVACTTSGFTARAMARFRPACRLVAATTSEVVAAQLLASWGVTTVKIERYETVDDIVWHAVEATVRAGHVSSGETVVVITGSPSHRTGATDVMRVVEIA